MTCSRALAQGGIRHLALIFCPSQITNISLSLTTSDVRGYSPFAAAKSAVGIGTPDICKAHNRAMRFFYAQSTVTSKLWWGVQGSRKARRVFTAGSSNPVCLTTK
ncbi:TPA: ash family protein [Enterobacter asburiae]|nr:ash family protein [Enterobacter asburiae]